MSKKASKEVSLNIEETKEFLNHIVSNNRIIQGRGKIPIATEISGDSGIGKTSITLQLAQEMGLKHVKLNLAQIEELGDLVGFPIRQFEVRKGDETIFIDENYTNEYKENGWKPTGNNQMGYCPPQWIANQDKGGFLILDDWNRADARFIQAVMELIDRQQYISWKLPKDWHIILTSNPDDGDYNVNSIDPAQRTRFISINLKFDVKVWAKWAETEGIDGRCINFLLKHPEMITPKSNARSACMFFNSISSIPVFENKLPLIQMIGEGSVGQEFSSLFTTFINNKLDRLLTPEEIIMGDKEKSIFAQLEAVIGKNDKYRADIASIISTRLTNYTLLIANGEKGEEKITKDVINRIISIVKSKLFIADLTYNLVKGIYNGNTKIFTRLLTDPELTAIVTK